MRTRHHLDKDEKSSAGIQSPTLDGGPPVRERGSSAKDVFRWETQVSSVLLVIHHHLSHHDNHHCVYHQGLHPCLLTSSSA